MTALDPGLALVVSVAVAGGLETAVGEPPAAAHPVALLGQAVEPLAGTDFGVPRLAGTVYALAVPTSCALVAAAAVALAARLPVPFADALLAGLVLWVASSVRLLVESGRRVVESSDTDLEDARGALLALVGRDASELSAGLVRSAAVESLAENFSDGFLAPLSAFVAFSFVSLPAAAAAAAFLKGANTMDSMFGYPGPFGWASARLDDALMFVPARASTPFLAVGAGDPEAPLRARRYAREPASPNAGWPMGTLAAALNVRLEKPGTYTLNGVAGHPTVTESHGAVGAVCRGAVLAYGVAVTVGVLRWL
ncbi:adenosylcobinamide-phosphate synthase [Natronomonas moolapensis 8.8.11]|uniref:Probable cobalamin biosynthesis protein CobD n=1 Tax=Natronomonas moolapensis (strain DSM 18674 / CECT 7526 / JCM 14361 / 8.8.11) TaxID=268739 RepID=M1Y2A6_NATM8|nr:adenosylcobinamide-phosphate synthase CbiB [Natronomonas moolapensis]CCQ36615.1 adenosylcobinamide-phosphate synthase [Natronomonas moolapensis 8.8.11]